MLAAHQLSLHVTINVAFLSWLLGMGCPIVVAILTQSHWPSAVKAILNAGLACLAGLIAVWIKTNGNVDVIYTLLAIAQAMIAAWASYYGFWKPTSIAPTLHTATDLPRRG
jgi:ABC-type amino acid transport system permease subunit